LKHPGLTKSDERLFESKIKIPANNRHALIELLNARLADTIDLHTQAKFAHWNVKGEGFYPLHLLFDSIAEHVEASLDLIAERITALGGRANGTARQAVAKSSIKEYDLNVLHGMDHVRALLDRLATVANAGREAISNVPGWKTTLRRMSSRKSFAQPTKISIFCNRICRVGSQPTVIESSLDAR